MISEPGLVEGPCFSHLYAICISPICSIGSENPNYHIGMGLHLKEGVEEHHMHIKLKSYKLKLLENW